MTISDEVENILAWGEANRLRIASRRGEPKPQRFGRDRKTILSAPGNPALPAANTRRALMESKNGLPNTMERIEMTDNIHLRLLAGTLQSPLRRARWRVVLPATLVLLCAGAGYFVLWSVLP